MKPSPTRHRSQRTPRRRAMRYALLASVFFTGAFGTPSTAHAATAVSSTKAVIVPPAQLDYPIIGNPGGEIKPFTLCSAKSGTGFVTIFGYAAAGNMTVNIGPFNRFTPAPDDRGQPTQFNAGTTNNAVVVFHQGQINWTLGATTATGPSEALCPDDAMPITGHPLSLFVWLGGGCLVVGITVLVRKRRARLAP